MESKYEPLMSLLTTYSIEEVCGLIQFLKEYRKEKTASRTKKVWELIRQKESEEGVPTNETKTQRTIRINKLMGEIQGEHGGWRNIN